MRNYIQVFTTTNTKKSAEKIADVLVSKRLAACVQVIGPVHSTYLWKGKKERSEEWLCIIKSANKKYGAIEKAIKKIHQYEVPEIIALPIMKGSQSYLNWIDKIISE